MSDPKNYGLVARGAPVKPPLFKMPQKVMPCESDRAHGGGVTMTGRTHMDANYGSYHQQKQKVEKFDSGLDEVTQYRLVGDPGAVTPISCTEDERGHLYVFHPQAKTTEAPASIRTKSSVESRTELSDSAIELSASSVSAKKTKIEGISEPRVEPEVNSKILRTVHHLFVEDEDGER